MGMPRPLKTRRSDEFPPEKDSQCFVKYTLLVVFLALVFWVSIMYVSSGSALSDGWNKISACVGNVVSCGPASQKTDDQTLIRQ